MRMAFVGSAPSVGNATLGLTKSNRAISGSATDGSVDESMVNQLYR
jgi:hypothetical protein